MNYRNWQLTLNTLIDEHIAKKKFFMDENKFTVQLRDESPFGFYRINAAHKIKILKVSMILFFMSMILIIYKC